MKKIFLIVLGLSALAWADLSRDSSGIITDTATDLQWQDDYSDNGGTIKILFWEDAINYCEALTLGGYSNWRLPNKNELLSIVDFGQRTPAIDPLFQQNSSYYYWTSTTRANDTYYAWIVFFGAGFTKHGAKFSNYFVRCVRAGQ